MILCKYSASHQTCGINYYKVDNTDFLISSFLFCSIVGMLLYRRAFPSLFLIYEFMYPFIHSYHQLGLMDSYCNLFLSLLILIFSVPLNGLQEPLEVSSHILLTRPHHSLNTSILTQNEVSGSSYIFPAPVLELANSPRSPGTFSWRRIFQKPKSGRQVRSLLLSVSLLPGPLSGQAQTDRCRRATRVYFCIHQKP